MADTYFQDVSLLIPMTGANGATTFTDYSLSPKTITAYGNAQISTAQSRRSAGSGYFDGTGDYLSIDDSVDFDFGNSAFTIEMWVYPLSLSNLPMVFHQCFFGVAQSAGWFIEIGSNAIYFGCGTLNQTYYGLFAVTIGLNAWTHIAVTRNGSIINAFSGGVSPGQKEIAAAASNYNKTSPVIIGGGGGVSQFSALHFNGYIQDVRITKGVARYTANFTPPDLATAAIAGNAVVAGNGAASQVVLRDWATKKMVRIATPGVTGDWSTRVPVGEYDITYFAPDCQPICHGPYTVTA